MAKFVMRKLAEGMNVSGGSLYPKLLSTGEVTLDDMAPLIARGTTFSPADLVGAVAAVVDEMAYQMGQGKTVVIPGLGRFRASLEVRSEYETEQEDGSTGRRTGRSVGVGGIGFKADRQLVIDTDSSADLERIMPRRKTEREVVSTVEERLAVAVDYLRRYHTMSVSQYAYRTGLERTAAQRELRRLLRREGSPLATMGFGSHILYILRPEAQEEGE